MAESRKQTIVMMCSIVGCIVTLITCGVLIGGVQADVVTLKDDMNVVKMASVKTKEEVSEMKTKQAFLEGVVSTQLTNIQSDITETKESIVEIHKQVDDLIRVD